MRWLDAAEKILREYGHALHYGVITHEIEHQNLVATQTKTPEITLHASLSGDIRRRADASLPMRFVRLGGGDFSMAEWEVGAAEDVLNSIAAHREDAMRQIKRFLRDLDGDNFVTFLEVLLTTTGYNVTVTDGTDDDGIDLLAERTGGIASERVGIQAKAKSAARRRIGPNTVRLLRDALPTQQCTSGAVMTTGDFDARAEEVCAEPGKLPVKLISGETLVHMAIEAGVGVRLETATLVITDLDGVLTVDEGYASGS